jgi:ecotin
MSKLLVIFIVVNFITLGIVALGAKNPDLKAFPLAEKGMDRYVVFLPEKDKGEEEAFMVEILAGKMVLTDGGNQVHLDGVVEPHTLEGQGKTYYEVTGTLEVVSTGMAAPEGGQKVKRFVSAPPLKVQYNSHVPIVVYSPEGYDVRYRLWKASEPAKSTDSIEPTEAAEKR